jgi:hypothetical protein
MLRRDDEEELVGASNFGHLLPQSQQLVPCGHDGQPGLLDQHTERERHTATTQKVINQPSGGSVQPVFTSALFHDLVCRM